MEFVTLFFTCVVVISVSGQFLDAEYRLDSVPLNLRRKPNSAVYEIQPSISREIEYQGGETARISNQGRRHIDDHQNIQNGNSNENEKLYKNENKYSESIQPTYNNEQQVNFENQPSARLQQQESYVRESNVLHTNRNSENRNQNNDRVTPLAYDKTVKTNLGNKHLHQNIQALPNQENFNQNSYPSNRDNIRINEDHFNQQTDTKPYENNRQSVPPVRTNSHSRHVMKASQTPDLYNYLSNGSVRTNEYPTNEDINSDSKYSDSVSDSHRNTEAINGRSIDSINYDNRQDVDSLRYKNNKNSAGKLNGQNIDTKRGNKDRNYESSLQSTEPSRRTTLENKLVTSGTKSTQDNELATKTHPDGRSGSKVGNGGSEMNTKTSISPTLPDVNDRAAFDGGKCPTGQIRFNNMCVYKD